MRHFGVICTRHQWRTQRSCLNTEFSPQIVGEYISYCSRSVLAKAQLYQWMRAVADRTWLVEVGDTNGLHALSPASLARGYAAVSVINKAPVCLRESVSASSMEPFGQVMTSCGFEASTRHTGNAARPWEYHEGLHSMITLDTQTIGYDLTHRSIPYGDYFDKQCFCKAFDASLATEACARPGLASTKERLWIRAICGSTALPVNWMRGLKTTGHDYIPTEDWSWPQCVDSMPESVIRLHDECTTDACEIDSDGFCNVRSTVERSCFCRNISYNTCKGPCHVFEARIDYVSWLHNLCGGEKEWDGLPEHWRQLASVTPLDMIPWTWYADTLGRSNPGIGEQDPGQPGSSCGSNEWKRISLVLINMAALFTGVFGPALNSQSTAPRPLNRILWFPRGITITALYLLANGINAVLVQSTPGYQDIPMTELALLWCSLPRLTWLTVALVLSAPYKRSTFSAVATSVVSEILLQVLSGPSMATAFAYASEHSFYSYGMQRLAAVPAAQYMYAGTLLWFVVVVVSSILFLQVLCDVGTPDNAAPRPSNLGNVHLAAQLKEPFVEQWTWLEEKVAEYWIDKDWDLEEAPLLHAEGYTYRVYGTLPVKGPNNRRTKRRMVRVTLIAIIAMFLLWVAQWMFWLGLIGLTAEGSCTPNLGLLTLTWIISSMAAVFGVVNS
jgi:hypothetical protein